MKSLSLVVTLTTDFGTADGYIGAVKGRILSIARAATLVDLSHDITPQNVLQGAWCLRRAAPRFPEGTVHMAVVDPGVGSWRSALAIETEHYFFVGPDNGLLSLAAHDDGIRRAIEIQDNAKHWQRSGTFDALSLFGPVAAHLASGMPLESIGTDAEDIVTLPEPQPTYSTGVIEGTVLFFDRYGNAITNISRADLESRPIDRVFLQSGMEAKLCEHYAQLAGTGRLGALWNSDGRLELSLYEQSLQQRLGLEAGEPVRVILRRR
jgi:S-adenosylmethionine hydrolase